MDALGIYALLRMQLSDGAVSHKLIADTQPHEPDIDALVGKPLGNSASETAFYGAVFYRYYG